MLLTLTTTAPPARDLGFLLAKHPDKLQTFALAFGQAHVFYPEADDARCTAALLLEVDPIQLVRGGESTHESGPLAQYVNDRPYVASSLLSVAIARVWGSALKGQARDRPELVEQPLPLEARLSALPCRGGIGLLRQLFEPLGYDVEAEAIPLDAAVTLGEGREESRYVRLTLRATITVQRLLEHLYVLIPVLDDDKHYWVGDDEIAKLLRFGERWLEAHPERELITRRYLKHQGFLARKALADFEDAAEDGDAELSADANEEVIEAPLSLHARRLEQVAEVLEATGAERVLDLGCGEGRLLKLLMKRRQFKELVGVDVSSKVLGYAQERLRLDEQPAHQAGRVTLLHGALTYRDRRLEGYDAAALVEVIEHLDPSRLEALERVVFGSARPRFVVLTTPNVEYNALFPGLAPGRFRHGDHRFEWTRAELQSWAEGVAARNAYTVTFAPVGPEDPNLGAPSQLALFTREADAARSDAP